MNSPNRRAFSLPLLLLCLGGLIGCGGSGGGGTAETSPGEALASTAIRAGDLEAQLAELTVRFGPGGAPSDGLLE